MKLFTPFTIPKKDNCDLCRIKRNNQKRGKQPLFFIAAVVAVESVGMDYRTLRKYVLVHPEANEFLERQTQEALDQSHNNLIAAAPTAAQRLIDVINQENNRGYVVIQAVESLFRIIDRGITDRENAEHIKEIKESLNALEGGKVFDV